MFKSERVLAPRGEADSGFCLGKVSTTDNQALTKQRQFPPMESYWMDELYIRAGPMSTSRWPKPNEFSGIFGDIFAPNASFGHFIFYLTFYLLWFSVLCLFVVFNVCISLCLCVSHAFSLFFFFFWSGTLFLLHGSFPNLFWFPSLCFVCVHEHMFVLVCVCLYMYVYVFFMHFFVFLSINFVLFMMVVYLVACSPCKKAWSWNGGEERRIWEEMGEKKL